MKLNNFEYLVPDSVQEACRFLVEQAPKAKVLSGGTDLIVQMRAGDLNLDYLIDIKGIPGLDRISYDGENGLAIGATVTLNQIAGSKVVREYYPVLAEGVDAVGSYQVRNRATLVGNICNASPLADSAPALLVYNAQVMIAGKDGERVVPIQKFFTGPGTTALQDGEIVTKVTLPAISDVEGCYLKHTRRKAVDLASISAAILIIGRSEDRVDQVRVSLGAVAPTPVRAKETEDLLQNAAITEELLKWIAETVPKDISPITDIRSSKDYRYRIASVLVKRGIKKLLDLE